MSCDRLVEVVAVHSHYLTVRPVTQPLCSACEQVGSCRSDWFRQKSPKRTFEIPLSDPISVNAGQIVTLSLGNHQLSLLLIKAYLPVLVGLIVPIIVGHSQGWSEIFQAGVAVLGLSLGWVVSRHWSKNFQIRVNR